jgi:hypothetical protein
MLLARLVGVEIIAGNEISSCRSRGRSSFNHTVSHTEKLRFPYSVRTVLDATSTEPGSVWRVQYIVGVEITGALYFRPWAVRLKTRVAFYE